MGSSGSPKRLERSSPTKPLARAVCSHRPVGELRLESADTGARSGRLCRRESDGAGLAEPRGSSSPTPRRPQGRCPHRADKTVIARPNPSDLRAVHLAEVDAVALRLGAYGSPLRREIGRTASPSQDPIGAARPATARPDGAATPDPRSTAVLLLDLQRDSDRIQVYAAGNGRGAVRKAASVAKSLAASASIRDNVTRSCSPGATICEEDLDQTLELHDRWR